MRNFSRRSLLSFILKSSHIIVAPPLQNDELKAPSGGIHHNSPVFTAVRVKTVISVILLTYIVSPMSDRMSAINQFKNKLFHGLLTKQCCEPGP